MLADEVARIGELEQQFGFVKNSAADLATVPKGLAGITKAHSAVNATPWAFISFALEVMMVNHLLKFNQLIGSKTGIKQT